MPLIGASWMYVLMLSDGSWLVVVVSDGDDARKNTCVEFMIPPEQVNGSDLFAARSAYT
jgi:hypothetical protein